MGFIINPFKFIVLPTVDDTLAVQSNTVNLSSYSFANTPIGDAAADRLVVVCVSGDGGLLGNVAGGTIAGNPLTLLTETPGGAAQGAILYRSVPSGTTATIVIGTTAAWSNMAIKCYALYGLTSHNPVDSASNQANSSSFVNAPIDISEGGIAIGAGTGFDTSNPTMQGVTLNNTGVIESSSRFAFGSQSSLSAQSNRDVGIDIGSVDSHGISAASWR